MKIRTFDPDAVPFGVGHPLGRNATAPGGAVLSLECKAFQLSDGQIFKKFCPACLVVKTQTSFD